MSDPRDAKIEILTLLTKELARENEEIDAEIDKYEEALMKILQWAEAYPIDIFPEPDLKKARALLEAGGMTLDSISAYAMRHVIQGVGAIARKVLDETLGE